MLRLVEDLNERPIIIRSMPFDTRVMVIWINKNGTKTILCVILSLASSVAAGVVLVEGNSKPMLTFISTCTMCAYITELPVPFVLAVLYIQTTVDKSITLIPANNIILDSIGGNNSLLIAYNDTSI